LLNYVSSFLFIASNAPQPIPLFCPQLAVGGWGNYANAVAWKVGAVLFAGCVAGVEGEGEDVETRIYQEIAITDKHGWTWMKRQKDGGKNIKIQQEQTEGAETQVAAI
jgi:hypothetical protein